jgi:hypothetical protein
VRLLFITITELISNGSVSDKHDGLENFLSRGIGGKIILLLSDLDLDLSVSVISCLMQIIHFVNNMYFCYLLTECDTRI